MTDDVADNEQEEDGGDKNAKFVDKGGSWEAFGFSFHDGDGLCNREVLVVVVGRGDVVVVVIRGGVVINVEGEGVK